MTENQAPYIVESKPPARLSARQVVILQCVAVEDMTRKEIAVRLGISIKAVKRDLAIARARLGVRSTAALVERAIRAGFLNTLGGTEQSVPFDRIP